MRSIYLNTIHIYSIEYSNIIGQLTTLNVFTQPNQHNFLAKTKIQVVSISTSLPTFIKTHQIRPFSSQSNVSTDTHSTLLIE